LISDAAQKLSQYFLWGYQGFFELDGCGVLGWNANCDFTKLTDIFCGQADAVLPITIPSIKPFADVKDLFIV